LYFKTTTILLIIYF